ncbi:zinc finger protein Xfin [Drosophila mojavensis]|uniref:C2H2-type domain-containing protein n=1 Tax=Drosophila mojavensis TaxID=7230 RepID=B4KHE6_DROMO|nr:zinc finger protein Xfin [Drosophila mojavensis]EDW11210.2 uncharacterized protein Dmoj_GI15179 [Drosophila mojavensis]
MRIMSGIIDLSCVKIERDQELEQQQEFYGILENANSAQLKSELPFLEMDIGPVKVDPDGLKEEPAGKGQIKQRNESPRTRKKKRAAAAAVAVPPTDAKKHYQCPHCPRHFERSDELSIHLLIHTHNLSYKCSYCPCSFSHKSIYTSHMYGHTGKFPHQCPDCPQGYMKYADLMKHQRTHIIKDLNRCPLCPKNCIHKGKSFLQCPECPRVFAKGFELEIHLQIHSNKLPYKCPHCPISFAHKSNFIAHVREHTGQFPHKCPNCPKGFMKRTDLIKHNCEGWNTPSRTNKRKKSGIDKEGVEPVEQHEALLKKEPVKSQVERRSSPRVKRPEKELTTAGSIQEPRQEKQQEPQESIQKDSTFANLSSKNDSKPTSFKTEPQEEEEQSTPKQQPLNFNSRLKARKPMEQPVVRIKRLRTHTCNVCSKEYPTIQELQMHEKCCASSGRPGKESSPYECEHCLRKFAQLSSLTEHKLSHVATLPDKSPPPVRPVKKPFKCPHCACTFDSTLNRKNHLQIHQAQSNYSYKCLHCARTYQQKSNFLAHLRGHTDERPYQCTYCMKVFKHSHVLKKHLRNHRGDRPYLCLHCLQTFAQSSHFHEHLQKHANEMPYKCPHCTRLFLKAVSYKLHLRTHTGGKS